MRSGHKPPEGSKSKYGIFNFSLVWPLRLKNPTEAKSDARQNKKRHISRTVHQNSKCEGCKIILKLRGIHLSHPQPPHISRSLEKRQNVDAADVNSASFKINSSANPKGGSHATTTPYPRQSREAAVTPSRSRAVNQLMPIDPNHHRSVSARRPETLLQAEITGLEGGPSVQEHAPDTSGEPRIIILNVSNSVWSTSIRSQS